MGKSLSTKCHDDIVEIRMVDHLQSFASAYEDLVMNMDKHLQIPSELYYQKCFVSFLEALCLRTIPATPRNQEYLVPTLKWSQSGTTIAQPDGIVVTKLCKRKARKHLAFACLEVKKASKSRHGGRSLPPRHGEPVIPAQCVHDSLATVLPQHFLELFISARETIFTTVRNKDDFKVLYYTKVGLVQQGMNVSVIILKLSEEKFESLVVSKEEGEKRKKATESWNMTQSRKRKTSDDGSSESPESDRAVSKIKKSKCDSNEDLLGESSMGTASTQDAMTEETLDNPVKTVRFQNVEKASSKETSDKLHVKAPQLYISKEYSLLDNQDRIELVQGLIMLEKISESILADRYGKLINP